ncbi:MAG: M10 family metallopeptidase C-terminal domain-containing protein [bacterium]|nr:M10 family metallopeptidase C-terminal domain-containing protein [bacterium]
MAIVPVTNSIPLTGDDNIDGVVQGGSWVATMGEPLVLTYTFYTGTDYTVKQWSSSGMAAITKALDAWASVANISFQMIEADGPSFLTSNADMAFTYAGDAGSIIGLALFPDPDYVTNDFLPGFLEDRTSYPNPEGDVFLFDASIVYQEGALREGSLAFATALHEIGHALGMKHPHDDGGNGRPLLPPALDNGYDTVMSYNDPQLVDLGEYASLLRGSQVTPMPVDIRAFQLMYGANMTYHTGNDVYELRADGKIRTIWDAGGIDMLDANSASGALQIDLREGALTRHGLGTDLAATAIAFNTVIENVYASAYNDIVTGNDADNTINGQLGTDTMTGGLGNDTYYVDRAGDLVFELAGEGTDHIISTVSFDLAASAADVENLTLTGGTVNGSGTDDDNTITGSGGKNTLTGLLGDDVLISGGGADTLIGGDGDDIYYVNLSTARIFENAGEGNDTVHTTVKITLGAELENLVIDGTGAVAVIGNNADNEITGNAIKNTLSGQAGDDTLVGNAGNDRLLGEGDNDTLDGGIGLDTLDGGTGADSMAGGLDNDLYYVDDAGDTVTEAGGEGIDFVQSSVTFSLAGTAAGVERLTLTGAGNTDATGNALDNTLTGNSGSNTLDGGAGADTMLGGAGNDFYIVDTSFDKITDTAGIDTVLTAITIDFPNYHALLPGIENITLTGAGNIDARGGATANVLTGNTGDNTLDGFLGSDTMIGGLGDDTYLVNVAGDIVSELAGQGTDTVISAVTFTIGAEIENLTLGNAGNGTGNAADNIITGGNSANTLSGLAGDDTLFGGLGNDTLLGGLDDDILVGGSGADRMTGGAGSDTFVFNLPAAQGGVDTITDFVSGAGNDVLDIADMLVGYTGTVTDFVQITQVGSNTIVKVDANGLTGGSSFVQIASLTGVNLGTDEAALVLSGNLVVL